MSGAVILRLTPENVAGLWPQLEPMIARALAVTDTHEPQHIYGTLMASVAHCWVQLRDTTTEAVVVTDFEASPKGLWLRAFIGSVADGYRLDVPAFAQAIKAWARKMNCRGIVLGGRLGWMRRFPDAKVSGVMLRVLLQENGDAAAK